MNRQLDGHRVLIAEDEFYQATQVSRLIEEAGGLVRGPFPNVKRAISEIEREKPDCAILDINFGQGTDFELADRLYSADIPFLFFTGYDEQVIPKRFAHAPLLKKPVLDRRLVNTVSGICCAS